MTLKKAEAIKALTEAAADCYLAGIEEAAAVVRKYLVHDSQRAVSWHEVQDCLECLEAIRALAASGTGAKG